MKKATKNTKVIRINAAEVNFKSEAAREKYAQLKKLNEQILQMQRINEKKLNDCFSI